MSVFLLHLKLKKLLGWLTDVLTSMNTNLEDF